VTAESIPRHYLIPWFGEMPLAAIKSEAVQRMVSSLIEREPKLSTATPDEGTWGCRLLDALDQIEVGKRAAVFVDVGLAVGSDQDWAQVSNTCRICRHKRLPRLLSPSR
jgi:hypothetical protein